MSTARADQVSKEIREELQNTGAVQVTSIKAPAIWGDAAEQRNGLVVEVGRRDNDVLFHFWHNRFPQDFPEQLYVAVADVMKATERFEASFTPEFAAVWSPEDAVLTVGEAGKVGRFRVKSPLRILQSWAVKAQGYGSVPAAHQRLTHDLVEAVENIFSSDG
jgi:hypothetical protein